MEQNAGKIMIFICPKCGKVEPKKIYYSCPAQADCPKCGAKIEDSSGGICSLSQHEADKVRPGFVQRKEK